MTRRRSSIGNRPFESLGNLIARKNIRLPEVRLPEVPSRPLTADEERQLFREAMADVIPLDGKARQLSRRPRPPGDEQVWEDPDTDALQQLKRLVATGDGFVLKHTAEYVEGAVEWIPPELFRRLHGGCYSVRDHVDLHGLNLAAAKAHFDEFMRQTIAGGKRAILVVHGRGRCSPGPPVLKQNVYLWLTRGQWKRWVIAFTSARACDGGTGATYVLLRRRPHKNAAR